MNAICAVTLIFMIYLSYRVFMIVRFSEPMYQSMLVCLELSLIGQMIFFGYQARIIRKMGDINMDTWQCMNSIIDTLPALFIAIASVINCAKWLNFLLKMRSLDGEETEKIEEKIQLLEKYRKRINLVATSIVFGVSSVLMYFYFKGCLMPYTTIEYFYETVVIKTTNVIMYSFLVIGILFFTIGVCFMLKLRQHQPVIY